MLKRWNFLKTGFYEGIKLGGSSYPAFDISAACSSFLYSLASAAQFIGTGLAKRALAQIHRRDDYAAAERAIGAREGDGPGTIWGRGGPVFVFSCRGETL